MKNDKTKILLVDDDIELVGMLKDYLLAEGFDVGLAFNGREGVQAALSGSFDLIVLDVMMPLMNGVEALKAIRSMNSLPVIMLTARGDDADRIIGLEYGADDYVPKPCTPRELTARIRAILRRVQAPGEMTLDSRAAMSVGALTVWPEARRAEWDGKPVELTSTEFSLLEILARNAGKPVSKADLSQHALGRPLARHDRNIDVHLSSIRHKLGSLPDGRSCIQTVYRLGYQLIRE